MEQSNQEITQKPSLPIKTNIVSWWFLIQGFLLIIIGLIITELIIFDILPIISVGPTQEFIRQPGLPDPSTYHSPLIPYIALLFSIFITITSFIMGIVSFFLSFYLLKKRKKAWSAAIIAQSATLIIGIFLTVILTLSSSTCCSPFILLLYFALILCFLSIVLLLLDRKNFFKIAS